MKQLFVVAIMAASLFMAQNVVAKPSHSNNIVEQLEMRWGGCIHPRLARRVIRYAACSAGMNFRRCWVRYVQGVNSIQRIPGGFRVALQRLDGGFVVIDVLEDL